MKARGKAHSDPHEVSKLSPKLRDELRTSIRGNILWDAVQSEDLLLQHLTEFCSHGEFTQWNQMNHLRESVDYGEDGRVTRGAGQTSDEIHNPAG